MAEVIGDKEFDESFKGVKYDKHPWSEWSNGSAYRVKRGEDFTCSVAGFCTGLYNYAKRSNLKVRAKKVDSETVEFQFRNA